MSDPFIRTRMLIGDEPLSRLAAAKVAVFGVGGVGGFCVEGLLDYQFRQIAPDAFEMLAEVSRSEEKERVRSEILRQMGDILREKHLDHVQFYVRFVEEILTDPATGKKPLIVPDQWKGERVV